MKNLLGILLLLLLGCSTKSQLKNNQTKFYYSLGKIGINAENYLNKINTIEAGFLDEGQFISKGPNKYEFNENLLENEINRGISDKEKKGFVYIDLEMPFDDLLGSDDNKRKIAIDYSIRVLKYAQKVRPNIKFGFYGIPFTSVWSPTPDYFKDQDKFAPLLKEVDIFYPSLYTFYSNPAVLIANGNYLENNIEGVIKMGINYKKPVHIFMWHRYHNSNEKESMKEIPDQIWKEQIETIASTNVNGKFADGILWWGADKYFYSRPEAANMRKEFSGPIDKFVIFNDSVVIRKAKIIDQVLKSKK